VAEPEISYTCLEGGYSGIYFDSGGSVSWGDGNIDSDPCFANPGMPDPHLSNQSPCINAGDPCYTPEPNETDIDGDPRVMLGRGDMGADEFTDKPVIEIWPTQFEFYSYEGGPNPQPQVLSICNGGLGNTLIWQAAEDCSWLDADPNSGTSTVEVNKVTLSIDISGLIEGIFNCTLTVSGPNAYNNPQTVDVNLVVAGPEIELSVEEFSFTAFEGGTNPQQQALTIRNSGGGTLNWVIAYDCNWLDVDPNFGSSIGEPNELTVSVDVSGLMQGIYDCNLTVSDPCACNNPQTVEVELRVFMEGWMDFGDCISPYPTLLRDNGARHTIDPNVFLGSLIDEEVDGQPSGQANGDDLFYLPDEDGIEFLSMLTPGFATDVEVIASVNGLLDAWIDFNIDGDWTDADEQIFAGFALSPGSNILTFDVPVEAIIGETRARFRFSTAGGLEPTGLADDGEVEDYKVVIEAGCFPIDDPHYQDWLDVGGPGCWCCEYHALGDSNGDGCIAILDLLMYFKPAYGSCWPEARYQACADCNHDKCVNILDLLQCFKPNYATCPGAGYDCPYD